MGSWIVSVNGIELPLANDPSIVKTLNALTTFSASFSNTDAARAAVVDGALVVLTFQGQEMLTGTCGIPRRKKNSIEISGKEQAGTLEKTKIFIGGSYYVDYTTTNINTILSAILTLKGYTLDLVNRPPATNITISFAMKNILEGVITIAETIGYDWYFVGTVLHMVSNKGVDRGELFNFNITGKDDNYDAIQNQIIVHYTNTVGVREFVTGDNLPSQALHGITQGDAMATAIHDAPTAQLYANALATDRGELPVTITFTLGIAEVISRNLDTGDDIQLSDVEYSLTSSDNWEIQRISIKAGSAEIQAGTHYLDKANELLRDLANNNKDTLYTLTIEMLAAAVQDYTTNLTFETWNPAGADSYYNSVRWGAPWPGDGILFFQDGTSQAVLHGEIQGMIITTYVYLEIGDTTLHTTTNFADLADQNRRLIAKLVPSTDIEQDCAIWCFVPGGMTINSAFIGRYAVGADNLKQGLQSFVRSVPITARVGSENSVACNLTGGIVFLADGTTHTINADVIGTTMVNGWNFAYWNLANTTVNYTQTYSLCIGEGKGLLAMIWRDTDINQHLSIISFGGMSMRFASYFIAAYAITTEKLTADQIYGKDLSTQINVGIVGGNSGIRIMGDTALAIGATIGDAIGGVFTSGIWGFRKPGGVLSRTFFIDPVAGTINIYGASMLNFKHTDGTLGGWIGGGSAQLQINATVGRLILEADGDQVVINKGGDITFSNNFHALRPLLDRGAQIGAPNTAFDLFLSRTDNIGGVPADLSTEGMLIYYQPPGGSSKVYCCMRRASGAFDWVQVAISV